MKISVIIPCYNAHEYLEECLNSVLQGNSICSEIICVDDFSTDDTLSILDSFTQKHNNIHVVRHQQNKGTFEARRSGTEIATGDYILYLDPDDRITLGCIDSIAKNLEHNPVDMLFFGFKPFGDLSTKEKANRHKYWERCTTEHLKIHSKTDALHSIFGGRKDIPWSVWAVAWKRNVVKKAFDMLPHGYCVLCEDGCLCFSLCHCAESANHIDFVGYEYRLDSGITSCTHANSQSRRRKILRSLPFMMRFEDMAARQFKDSEESLEFAKEVVREFDDACRHELCGCSSNDFTSESTESLCYFIEWQERHFREQVQLLKSNRLFYVLVTIAKSIAGLKRRASRDVAKKIRYNRQHAQFKALQRLLSSK